MESLYICIKEFLLHFQQNIPFLLEWKLIIFMSCYMRGVKIRILYKRKITSTFLNGMKGFVQGMCKLCKFFVKTIFFFNGRVEKRFAMD